MRLFALVLSWLAVLATAASAQTSLAPVFATGSQTSSTGNIEVELVPMSRWAAPGSTAVVALRQRISPGWHTYWRNPGDSGGPTTLTWALPAGATAGEIVWPMPERQRLQGLVNYGYSGDVLLPTTIQIPADATPGATLPLRVEADLFVCSDEMCIPETFRLALDLPIRDGAAPMARHGADIQRVLQAAPRPAGIAATWRNENGVVTLSATGGPLSGADPGATWFFPFEPGRVVHAAPQSGRRGSDGLTIRMTAGPKAVDGPLAGVLQTSLGAFEIEALPGEAAAGTTNLGPLAMASESSGAVGSSPKIALWRAALLALLGGLVLNFMPCVFPVLAMKAAALARAAGRPEKARRDGALFTAGVAATFLTLAAVLLALRAGGHAVGWGFQLQSPAVTAGLAMLMLAVGLNLSSVFHVGAGMQGLGRGPLARAPEGVDAFLTGALTVVVAAPCTAPFMAVAMGAALVMSWPAALLVFLMLGLGLALPYLAISLSPALLRRLPRPGAWMETLKSLLALPMYGAALWLGWVAWRQVGDGALALLVGAGLALATSLWIYGRGQRARMAGGRAGAHLAGAMAALFAAVAMTAVVARMPPSAAAASGGRAPAGQPWSRGAVETALSQGRPVLVNFTADWCVTCKINEGAALSSARTKRALEETNAVYLVADWTRRDDAITAELTRMGRSGVPLYLIWSPAGGPPRVLPQLLTDGAVVDALSKASAPRPPAAAGR